MTAKILVIEDEATQVLLLTARLTQRGFTVSSAMSGEEGLRKALEDPPDLVLLDILLPGISGVEVCQRLKEHPETQAIPIILVTASGMRGLEERCRTLGAAACLVKPYQPQELLERVQRFLPSSSPHREAATPSGTGLSAGLEQSGNER